MAATRALTVNRDGYCRLRNLGLGPCDGPSEWAHYGASRRFKTRGQAPEARHTTAGSLMLCRGHHARLDGRAEPRVALEHLTERRCDGPLRASADGGATWVEA